MIRKYAAFISYRHCPLDIAVAERIHKSIEHFHIPKDLRKEEAKKPGAVFTNWVGESLDRNLLVFRDREELPLTNDLTADIFTALDHSKCLIVVCTPETPKSLWVRREISYFIEKHGRQRIITVLAAGTPETSIPKEITTVYHEDGATVLEEYEPLVAYIAADSKQKVLKNMDKEMLRLYAALLGCPYDTLRQRHKRRKMQQTLAAITAALLVALSFIGMLINRNLEIESQKRSVQLRESELLAADAEEALLSGDTLRAIDSAIRALPKEGEPERPYYAPAESALIEAMDILGGAEAPVLLKEIAMEQMTPITHFCLSTDGAIAVTLDDYGVLHCFDTISGEELWTDILTADTDGSEKTVMISDDNQFLLCRYYNLLECRKPATGEILWSCPLEISDNCHYIYDHVRNQIALLRCYFNGTEFAYSLELTLLHAENGEILSQMVMEQPDSSISYTLVNTSTTRSPRSGVFSEDGRYFACAFQREDKTTVSTGIVCFVMDLDEMCVVMDYCLELNNAESYYVTAMDMRDDHVLLSVESTDDTFAATVLKLDITTGEALWCTTTPSELEDSTFSLDQTSSVLFWDAIAIVGRYEKLYAIDLDTGAILNSIQLPGSLSYLYTVGPTTFAYSLSDGTYAIGWFNATYGFTLTTDPFYQLFVDVGPHTLLLPFGGGIVQMYTDGNYFELSVSNVAREGYLAFVPDEAENQLVIKRPISVEKPVEETVITLPVKQDDISCTESEPVFCSNNTVILGPFSIRLEDGNSQYFYTAIDRETHQVVEKIDVPYDYHQKIQFLSDGTGYLRYANGTTWLHKGETTVPIAEKKDLSFPEASYLTDSLIATDTVRLTDGSLLTAHCDSKNLTLRINGEETAVLPLPQEHCYDTAPTESLYRQVFAGRSGAVLISCNAYDKDILSDSIALYDAEAGWLDFSAEFSLNNTHAVAFAGRKKQIALVDANNQVWVFQQGTGEPVTKFPLQFPSRAVIFMDFILEDNYLLVKTTDSQVLIYDLSTGEICFHSKMGSTYTGILYSYLDTENQRLYIIDSNHSYSPNCLCLDLRSWTVLGTGSRILLFDEYSGELIHFDQHYDAQDSLSCIQIPGTQELVQLGQQLLSAH